jgi:hypothetical protein
MKHKGKLVVLLLVGVLVGGVLSGAQARVRDGCNRYGCRALVAPSAPTLSFDVKAHWVIS